MSTMHSHCTRVRTALPLPCSALQSWHCNFTVTATQVNVETSTKLGYSPERQRVQRGPTLKQYVDYIQEAAETNPSGEGISCELYL